MSPAGNLSHVILLDALCDFRNRNLNTEDLCEGYEGLLVSTMFEKHVSGEKFTKVDFDLSLDDLERDGFITTGPYIPYENDPNSSLLIFGGHSRREYISLTENGYRMARSLTTTKVDRSLGNSVNISGGVFHNSPIGVGAEVNQTPVYSITASDDLDALRIELERLCKAALPEASTTPERLAAIGKLAEAQMAAEAGDGRKVEQSLSSIGQATRWLLSIAEKIGVGLAVAKLKSALDI